MSLTQIHIQSLLGWAASVLDITAIVTRHAHRRTPTGFPKAFVGLSFGGRTVGSRSSWPGLSVNCFRKKAIPDILPGQFTTCSRPEDVSCLVCIYGSAGSLFVALVSLCVVAQIECCGNHQGAKAWPFLETVRFIKAYKPSMPVSTFRGSLACGHGWLGFAILRIVILENVAGLCHRSSTVRSTDEYQARISL